MSDETQLTEGWVTLVNSRKFHYVRNARALCGGWAYLGSIFDADDGKLGEKPQRDDCAKCWRERKKELAPAPPAEGPGSPGYPLADSNPNAH